MNLCFHDNDRHLRLAPLTLTRPVAEIRFGIFTISESWCKALRARSEKIGFETEDYLLHKYPKTESPTLTLAGNIKPSPELIRLVQAMADHERLMINGKWIASKGDGTEIKEVQVDQNVLELNHCWDLFQKAAEAIELDLQFIREEGSSHMLSSTNQLIGNDIFIEEGAKVEHVILNSETGPIYIGKNAEVMEGSVIRGPFALGENAVVKMSAKIYGPTVIGPFCKVGGEITNSVMQGYSNKGHDGFMGNSVIGEWCNLGADTNTSNLKNNYSNLKIHSFETGRLQQTSLQFCGVLMGDHSKTGINTMLNTGTTVGVSANIFDAGFPPKFIPSFSWGGHQGEADRFILEKAFEVATNMMKRRNVPFTEGDQQILKHLYELS